MIPWECAWGEHSRKRKEPMVWLRAAEYVSGGEETQVFVRLAPPNRERPLLSGVTSKYLEVHFSPPYSSCFFPPYSSCVIPVFSSPLFPFPFFSFPFPCLPPFLSLPCSLLTFSFFLLLFLFILLFLLFLLYLPSCLC